MTKLFIVFGVAAAISFFSMSRAKATEVACRPDGHSAIFSIGPDHKEIMIPDAAFSCEAGFEFLQDHPSESRGLLLLAPMELGLCAKMALYGVSFEAGSVGALGVVPASAEYSGNGKFSDVFSEGQSIHRQEYAVVNGAVTRVPVSLEFVVGGEVCLAPPDRVRAMVASTFAGCANLVEASFSDPVCILHRDGSAARKERKWCQELEMAPTKPSLP
jgi:hypothetical protein